MQRRDIEALRIACDPVSYHYRWRHAHTRLNADRRTAVNAVLVAEHGLVAIQTGQPLSSVATRLIQGWSRLPAAAELLALAKQPRAAMAHADFLRLPLSVRQFPSLGFACSDRPWPRPLGRDALRAWGAGYLLNGLSQQLPPWLAQRLALPFESINEATGVSPQTFDMSCFWSALSHAQTVTATARH